MKRNVGQVMTADPVAVSPSTPFKEIVRLMKEHRISGLPVVEGNGRVVGLVTEGDLILKESEAHPADAPLFEGRGRRERRLKAAGSVAFDVMTRRVHTVGPSATIEDAARLMIDRRIKRLPVVDGSGRLIGIASRSDLLDVFLRDDGEIRQEIVERALMPELRADHPRVTVDVRDGVVTLAGRVGTRSEAASIGAAAERVEGVVQVVDGISWDRDDTPDAGTLLRPAGISRW